VTTAAHEGPRLTEQFPNTWQHRRTPSDLSSELPNSDRRVLPVRGRRQRHHRRGVCRRRGT